MSSHNFMSHTASHVSSFPSVAVRYQPICVPSWSSSGSGGGLDGDKIYYDGALQYLFTIATQDPAARDLCREIDLKMSPPFRDGVLQCLLRLQAIDRIDEWPMLFGKDNPFILHMLERISKNEFAAGCGTEKMIWDLRRKETADWRQRR